MKTHSIARRKNYTLSIHVLRWGVVRLLLLLWMGSGTFGVSTLIAGGEYTWVAHPPIVISTKATRTQNEYQTCDQSKLHDVLWNVFKKICIINLIVVSQAFNFLKISFTPKLVLYNIMWRLKTATADCSLQ